MAVNKAQYSIESLLGDDSSFTNMSKAERGYFVQLLQEEIKRRDAESTPEQIREIVPIDVWINSEYYVGPDCKSLYPFWKDFIIDVFREDRTPEEKITQVILGGSIGIGKSTAAEIMMMRKLYELSCWKNVNSLFKLMSKTSIMFLYFSVNKRQAERTGFGDIRNLVDRSPYFQENFKRLGRMKDILLFPEGLTFAYGSGTSDSIGMSVIGTIMDEANFVGGYRDSGNAEKASEMYAGIVNRANSRFIIDGGINHSLNILVSSSTTESSVVERQIAASKDDPHTIVCAPSQWEVKPDKFSKVFFYVCKGTDYLEPHIVRSTDDVNNFRISEGMKKESYVDGLEDFDSIEKEIKKLPPHQQEKFLRVPVDLKQGFETNIMRSLQDMGGVSVASTGKLFNSVAVYNASIHPGFMHPFISESITISTGDQIEIKDFLRSDFRLKHPERPRFIHIDQSYRTDDTGISCVYIDEIIEEDGVKKPVFGVDFMLQINPPNPPKKIAIYKIRNFVVFLDRVIGMKLGMVSYDIFNSEESRQILEEMGYNVRYQSVDRTDKAYLDTVEIMYEGRLRMYDYKIFRKEIFNVIHYRDKRKVDHPKTNPDGCLLGGTEIKLLDGSYRTIESLVGESNIEVYGCLEDGRIVPAVASRVWKTKEVSTIVRVTLDSGEVIECTENHPFMLRNGSYLRADELSVGMSLMPLRYDFNGKFLKGYERVWDNFYCRWRYTHSLVDEFYNGSLPKGYIVHHYDVNKLNNTRDNLQRKTREEHGKIHAMLSELGNTPENVEKRAKSLSENSKERGGLPKDFPIPYWVYKKLLNSWYITDEDREKAKSNPYVIIEKYNYYNGNEEELRKHKRELALNNESFMNQRFNSPSDEAVRKRIKSYRENHSRKFNVDYSFELRDCEIEHYINMSSLSRRDKKHIKDNPKILLDTRFQDYIKNKVTRNKTRIVGIMSKSLERRKKSSDNMTYLNTQGYWKHDEGIKRRKELAQTQLVDARKKRMDREDLEWISKVDKNIPIVSVNHAKHLYGGGSVAVERRLKIMGINFSDNLKIAEKMSDDELRSIKLSRKALNGYLGKYNHKVKSVEIIHLDSAVPVYDMEVPSTHNFALAAGIFVHNSTGTKDVADSLVGAVENALQFKIGDSSGSSTIEDFIKANEIGTLYEPDALTAEQMVDKQLEEFMEEMEYSGMGGFGYF